MSNVTVSSGSFNGINLQATFYFADTSTNVAEWLEGKEISGLNNATCIYRDSAENPVIIYDITLNLNDGQNTTEVIQACNEQHFIFPVTEREGYIFTGWYTTSACSTQVANLYGVTNARVSGYTNSNGAWIGGVKTLYAGWVEIIDLTLNLTNNLTTQLYDGYIIVQIGDYVSMISVPRNKSNVTLTLKEVLAGDLKLSIKLYGDITITSADLVISDNQRYCYATIMESSVISLTLSNSQ